MGNGIDPSACAVWENKFTVESQCLGRHAAVRRQHDRVVVVISTKRFSRVEGNIDVPLHLLFARQTVDVHSPEIEFEGTAWVFRQRGPQQSPCDVVGNDEIAAMSMVASCLGRMLLLFVVFHPQRLLHEEGQGLVGQGWFRRIIVERTQVTTRQTVSTDRAAS